MILKKGIEDLPEEVILHLLETLDVNSILAVRKCCRRLHNLSKDIVLWRRIINLKSDACLTSIQELPSLHEEKSALELERLAVSSVRVSARWLTPRKPPPLIIPRQHADPVIAMEMFDDGRSLLAVSSQGQIDVWDVAGTPFLWAQRILSGSKLGSCASRYYKDLDGRCVILAVTSTSLVLRTPGTTLLKVTLPTRGSCRNCHDPSDPSLIEYIIHYTTPFTSNVRELGIGNTMSLVAYSRGCFIDIVDSLAGSHATISTHIDELDEFWNGIIGLRFCGDKVLCIKMRSIELYTIPELQKTAMHGDMQPHNNHNHNFLFPRAIHHFRDNNFREARMSEYLVHSGDGGLNIGSARSGDNAGSSVRVLLSDVLHGLYLYDVQIQPDFAVTLRRKRVLGPKEGFVGAFALGQRGVRGVWVERKRSDTQREVMAFAVPNLTAGLGGGEISGDEDEGELARSDHERRSMLANAVFGVKSYDLREDLIHCAFSELTGRIALGKRGGDIVVLDCWRPRE